MDARPDGYFQLMAGDAQYIPDVVTLRNGVLVSRRPNLNLIPGANVTLNVTDNDAQDRVDVEIISAGGGGYTDIRDYGAVNNQDSGAAINAAITAAQTSTGKVFIPYGDFIAETSVIHKPGVQIFGNGIKSRLIAKAGLNAPVITGTNVPDAGLENFCIDGNMANQSSFSAHGISYSATARLRVEGLSITNCMGHGVWGTGLSKSKFLYNQIYDTGGVNPSNPTRGLWLNNTVDSLIKANTVRGAYGFAMTLTSGCAGVKVIGNDMLDSTTYDGIIVYGCKDITVANNTIKNVADSGIVFEVCEDVTAIGNTIRNAWLCGIYVVSTMYATVKGNTLRDNAIAVNGVYSDISLSIGTGVGSRCIISGNTVISASTSPNYRSKYGLLEHNWSDSNIITDNQFVGQTVAAMCLFGPNTTQANNKYNGVTVP